MEDQRLTSWKQIARYLGRDRRTVMRWEKRWGLPVHRIGGKGNSVYAFRAELDAWLAQGGAPEVAGEGAEGGAEVLEEAARRPPRTLGLTLAAAFLSVFAFKGLPLLRSGPAASGEIVIQADRMTALAEDGSVAWVHRHPQGRRYQPLQLPGWRVDLEDGPAPELVVAANTSGPWGEGGLTGELSAFSERGRPLWTLTLEDTIRFGGRHFEGPWVSAGVEVRDLDGRPRLFWRVHHSTWWPSMVVELAGDGRPVGRFVNPGWLLATGALDRPEGDALLVGGISNAHERAMLAVLGASDIGGSAPEEDGSPFACADCPPGRPAAYLLFGRSHVNVAEALPYNRTSSIQPTPRGFRVVVLEGDPESDVHWLFEFSRDLELLSASPGDTYWPRHRRLRHEGRIDHGEEECPERASPPPVTSWTPRGGWTALTPTGG